MLSGLIFFVGLVITAGACNDNGAAAWEHIATALVGLTLMALTVIWMNNKKHKED